MTSFKKFVHAKEKITETVGFPKTMNKNYIIRKELESINEFAGAAAATKGGEIDSLMVAIGAAGALFAKAMYNGIIYKSLMGEMPGYLEKYKKWSAPSADAVFKATTGKAIEKLKQQKATLSGTGGDREDRSGKPEQSAEDKIRKMFEPKVEAAKGEAKEAVRKQRDEAIEKVKLNIQSIAKKIEELQNQSEDLFAKGQEKFRQEEEKWAKKQDGFVEGGGALGSSWKTKWGVEYRNAKEAAKLEVLAQAKKIATDAKNDKEVAAITKAEERAKQNQAEADKRIKEVEDESEQAEREMASAGEFKIPEYIQALQSYDIACADAYGEWDKKSQGLDKGEGEGDESSKKATLAKIEKLKEKITKVEDIIDKLRNSKEDDDVKKVEKGDGLLKKFKEDIKAEEAKLKPKKDYNSFNDFYSMQLRLIETNDMINNLVIELGLFEEEESSSIPKDGQVPNLSQIRAIIKSVIAKTPEEGRQKEAANGIATLTKLKAVKADMNKARNDMAAVFTAQAEEEDESKKKQLSPELKKGFGSLKAVDAEKSDKTFDEYIQQFKDDYEVKDDVASNAEKTGTQDAQQTATDNQETLNATDKDGKPEVDEEAIKAAEGEVSAAKEEYDKVKDGEDKKAISLAEIKHLQAQQKLSKLKGDDAETQARFPQKIELEMKKIQDLEKTPDESDPADGDSEEIKKQKEKVKSIKKEIENTKSDPADAIANTYSIKKTDTEKIEAQRNRQIELKTKDLTKELEKLKELQKKEEPAETAKEAVDPDELEDTDDELENTKDETPDLGKPKSAPKFMKFEDYIISKQKK